MDDDLKDNYYDENEIFEDAVYNATLEALCRLEGSRGRDAAAADETLRRRMRSSGKELPAKASFSSGRICSRSLSSGGEALIRDRKPGNLPPDLKFR